MEALKAVTVCEPLIYPNQLDEAGLMLSKGFGESLEKLEKLER